jgi:hypothetical protein
VNVYDRLEEAGHDITLVVGLQAGVSTYFCERCASIIQLRSDEIRLFHSGGHGATESKCAARGMRPQEGQRLGDKLRRLEAEDMERFRQAMED